MSRVFGLYFMFIYRMITDIVEWFFRSVCGFYQFIFLEFGDWILELNMLVQFKNK